MRSLRTAIRRRLFRSISLPHPDRELAAAEFDAAYYLAANPDVAKAGVDPVQHFLALGWREGRDPSRAFSVRDYLDAYPDIAEADVNPFVHFLRAGRAEGRVPKQDLGFRYQVIAALRPIEDRVRAALDSQPSLTSRPEDLARALAATRSGLKDMHVTFSHDDYTANVGGVQLCLQREAAELKRRGVDHLHVFPAVPWPVVRVADEAGRLGALWNGRFVGVFAPADVARVVRKTAGAGPSRRRSFAIHSLLGHAADETADIVEAAGLSAGFFWLHDFASLCAGFHLLRNDVEDCGAPPPDSAACGICVYRSMRMRHLAEHERLFRRLSLTVVSPSEAALATWRAAWTLPAAKEVVLPHLRLRPRRAGAAGDGGRPFRLAFLGAPATHKGWEVFQGLAQRHGEDRRYSFHHMGAFGLPGPSVAFRRVSASAASPRAMAEAIEALEADAALVWPLCRETFSFTAHEAAAGGAAVITNPDSGNVAAFVRQSGLGTVLDGEEALAQAFESGDILRFGRGRRPPFAYDLEFSALTLDLIPATAGA